MAWENFSIQNYIKYENGHVSCRENQNLLETNSIKKPKQWILWTTIIYYTHARTHLWWHIETWTFHGSAVAAYTRNFCVCAPKEKISKSANRNFIPSKKCSEKRVHSWGIASFQWTCAFWHDRAALVYSVDSMIKVSLHDNTHTHTHPFSPEQFQFKINKLHTLCVVCVVCILYNKVL